MANRLRRVPGKDPSLVYTVEDEKLPDGKYRTLSIEGPIRFTPGRVSHARVQRAAFDDIGHLIADQFGGPGSKKTCGNLVSMHHLINKSSGPYAAMEREIRMFLGDRTGTMQVRIEYEGSRDPWRPHAFQVTVTYSNGMRSKPWYIYNYNPFLEPKHR